MLPYDLMSLYMETHQVTVFLHPSYMKYERLLLTLLL